MSFKHVMTNILSAIASTIAVHSAAFDVSVTTHQGESFILEFQPEDTIQTVYDVVSQYSTEENPSIILEIENIGACLTAKANPIPKALPRDYYAPVTPQEKKDISYILRTLANNSWAKIAKEKSNLKKAGDRIDGLHPFKFLETVFGDEELKVCVRNIEGKNLVWSDFLSGITDSLGKEAAVGNLKVEYVYNMANLIKIDANQILPIIQNKNWSKLVTDLIALVPRNGDANRYNM